MNCFLVAEFSQWFSLEQTGEGVSPTISDEIPQVVVENNRHLLFTVVANKPGALAARAAISIDLPGENLAKVRKQSWRIKITDSLK